ncbi:hypothetical protein BT93_E1551 [Corymbia citriodora subsp. variegata]|nr:hypothetical protein BT93_E1551 [Corymbia citriodora subsp. variegata]
MVFSLTKEGGRFYIHRTETSRVTGQRQTQSIDPSLHRPSKMKREREGEETATAAGTGSSCDGRLGRGYEVFLNFRGPNTRLTIADTLYNDMIRAGIRVFKDNEELRVGEEIGGGLLQAINDCRIYIPIFSENFTSSKWCLRELAHIVKLSRDNTEKKIFPIFYHVDVDDVKLKTELYRKALQKHESDSGKDVAKQWEEALREVTRIKGWKLEDYGLHKLTNLMVEEVSNLLWTRWTDLPNHLVGIKHQMDHIMKLLDLGAFDVRFIVIHGMGGIGKTTLAEAVFRQISPQFRGHCYFLKDVQIHDIINLQKKLLSDVHKTRFRSKKVLIVLDDINDRNQIMRLAGEEGDDDNLSIFDSKQFSFYDMPEMNSHDALQLFCERALGCAKPLLDFMDITKELINALGGLPLALDVIGSTLRRSGKCLSTWEGTLSKLKKVMNKDVKNYEALEPIQQQIYLDIACLFFNKEKTTAVKYWNAIYGYQIEIEVNVLKHMSLIKISSDDKLWMHDQLRDLGRNIVDPESGEIHMRGSRLWFPEHAFHVVQTEMIIFTFKCFPVHPLASSPFWSNIKSDRHIYSLGTKDIVALNLGTPYPNNTYRFKPKQFAGLVNLTFLQLDYGNFDGDFKNVFSKLRWLSWSNCPSKFRATNFGLTNLTILMLCGNNVTEDWGGWCQIMLDYLEIKSESIESLPKSIDGLKSLMVLRIVDKKPSMLPHSIGNLAKMKHLILPHRELQKLPDSIGRLQSLVELDLSYSKINELPHFIGNLERLKLLCCRDCHLEKLPNSFGRLQSLVKLDLSYSKINELPHPIGNLERLKALCCWGCHLEKLPDSIGRLQSLLELNIRSTKISELPHSIGNLERLKILDCFDSYLENLPDSIGRLQSLVKLNMMYTKIKILPNCIGNLKKLEELDLNYSQISELPKTIGMLENLEKLDAYLIIWRGNFQLDLSGGRFSELPATINQLSNLQALRLYDCDSIQRLPELPKSLTVLVLRVERVALPPIDFSSLSQLRDSHKVEFRGCPVTIDWSVFSNLENLSTLSIVSYSLGEIRFEVLGKLRKFKNCGVQLSLLKTMSVLPSLKEIECCI